MKLWQYILAPFAIAAIIARVIWSRLTGGDYEPPSFG